MNYDPNLVFSGRARQLVRLTFGDCEYRKTVEVSVGGNCGGLSVIECAVDDVYEKLEPDRRGHIQIQLEKEGGGTLVCDENGEGSDFLKDMLIAAEIIAGGGKEMNDDRSAFPIFDSTRAETDYMCVAPGMTLRQYAAIKLKVPRSEDPDIDAMIRESRRYEFAKAALNKLSRFTLPAKGFKNELGMNAMECIQWDVKICRAYADAMLAEMDKEEKK